MKHRFLSAVVLAGAAACSTSRFAAAVDAAPPAAAAKPPVVPAAVGDRAGVKKYLVEVLDSVQKATGDLKVAGTEYADLVAKAGGTPAAAAKADPQRVADLVRRMRDAYQRIDSYGYEYVEGIVAGVPALMKYDVELDSGVPAAKSTIQDQVPPIVIHAGPLTIDKEGSLNNYLIEPTVFGTNPRFTSGQAVLPGLGDKPVGLPNPQLVVALADYAIGGYGRLRKDADAWQPTDADCFHIMANMTPTLADYFEEWKESKKFGSAAGGRFVAVSRVSDMRGIMTSTQLAWQAVRTGVRAKDAPLADSVSLGYAQVLKFIDTVDAREQKKPLNVETIDALGTQAKERADKLTVQAGQAAALVGVNVDAK
ncbi:MAG: uncharacterized protein JWO31_2074 [Phycisphaerales bacterium]|nr:uncharacterized protein [Phycisphaerales bacterium]